MRRITALAIALTALLCASGTRVPAADTTPYVINAVISQTGGAAFVGQAQMKSMEVAADAANRAGGINGRPIKFTYADDQSSPQVAVQLVTRHAAEGAPVIFGPSVAGSCAAVSALVAQRGPMLYCMSPAITPPAGGYVFSAGATLDAAGLALVRYARLRGWTRLAAISSTDGSGQAFDHAIQSALMQPENKDVQMLTYEHMNPADISAASQIARIKAANPQVVLTLATGTPWATIMRGIRDTGMDVPIIGGHSNASYDELEHFKDFLPREVYFPGLASVVSGSYGRGAVANAQAALFAEFDRQHIKSDIPLATGWDPVMIVVSGLRKLGTNATAEQLRDYVLSLHHWAGVQGFYDFSDGQQRGLTVEAIVMDRWDRDASRFVAVSRPGGYPL